MGLIRGGLLFIVSVLLFFSLLTLNSFLTVSSSLQYENVQEQLVPVVQDITNHSSNNPFLDSLNLSEFDLSQIISENQDSIREYCENYSDYVFAFEDYALTLPCDKLNEANQTSEVIINEAINSFIEQVYYKDYSCGFWDCFDKKSFPFFLISEKAKDYWKGKFYLSLIVSLILIMLVFFLLEKKLNLPILVGVLLALSALPLVKLGAILSKFIDYPVIVLFNIFFSQAQRTFWISFFIGIFLVAGGIALRFVNSSAISWLGSKIDSANSSRSEKKSKVNEEKTDVVKKGKKK